LKKKNTAMKKLLMITGILLITVSGINAQQQKEQESPDEQIIVNKKYDEQGNLIEYDSTYIHQWSTDTTFHFGFPGDSLSYQYNFPGIERFMKEFWNDTVFGSPFFPRQPFSLKFRFSPFDDEEFDLPPGSPWFTDSMILRNFPFQFDSLYFDFGFDPPEKSHHKFNEEFFKDFEQRLNQHFFRFRDENFGFPKFKNKEYQEEWEQLMEKHRQEMEELRKKWQEEEHPGRKI
jgi:hypothetical protein